MFFLAYNDYYKWKMGQTGNVQQRLPPPPPPPPPPGQKGTISQNMFSDAFSWMRGFVFWLKFHWNLFLRVQLTTRWVDGTPTTEVTPVTISGRSLYLTLVTKWSRSHMTLKIQISRSWPRSNPFSNLRPRVQIDMFAFRLVAIGPLLVKI